MTSSTDFMLPYTFLVELMGDRATLRQDLLQSLDAPIDLDGAARSESVSGRDARAGSRRRAVSRAVRIRCADAGLGGRQRTIRSRRRSTSSSRAILEGRDTSIDVFDAQKTMEVCLAADRIGGAGRPAASGCR